MKRALLHIVLPMVMLFVATACAAGPASTTKQGPLVVLDWSGYEQEVFWADFKTKHPDVKVEWTFFADDPEAFAKLQSGYQADLVHPNISWLKLYVDNDLLIPIDTAKLSNWSKLDPDLIKMGQVDGVQYLAPWEWGYDSILVRTDKVAEVPDSWADLWDPQYKGHVSVFDSAEAAVMVAATVLGFDPYAMTEDQLAQVKQKLIDLKPNLLGYWTDYTEINQQVASGDVWVAGMTWPDAWVAVSAEGVPVEYITPIEGRLGWVYGYAIPKSGANHDLALDYMDALLATSSMVEVANQYAYGAANREALAQTDPSFVTLMGLEDPDILKNTIFFQSLTQEERDAWTALWSEVKAAQ